MLKLACLATDCAEALRLEIKETGHPPGSTGQPRVNPLITVEGATRKRVAAFL